MADLSRQDQLLALRTQLEHWEHNLSPRVADEAQALALELHKLHDDEIDQAWAPYSASDESMF